MSGESTSKEALAALPSSKGLRVRLVIFGVLFAVAVGYPIVAWGTAPPAASKGADDHGHAPALTAPGSSKLGAPHVPPAHPVPVTSEDVDGKHASGEHGDEHGGGEHGHWPPPGINWTDLSDPLHRPPFIAMVVNFVILFGAYYFLGKKPIAAALKARRDAVAKEIEEAQRMKKEAEARAKQYQAKLERLEEELVTAKAALVEAGRGERDRIVRDAEEKAARMQKDAQFRIEQEMRQIRQELWRETVESAVNAAEDLLKKRITSSDQERLAEDYLRELAGGSGKSIAPPAPGAGNVGGAS